MTQIKNGIIVKIAHLKGASDADAKLFFEQFDVESSENYNMRSIGDDWYLERVCYENNIPDLSNGMIVTQISSKTVTEFTNELLKAVCSQDTKLGDPIAYVFVGNSSHFEAGYHNLVES